MSERRACRVIDADRKSVRYRSTRDDDAGLREKLRELANQRRRFGYRRLHILLRREGVMINRKKTQRLYREEGLAVPAVEGPVVARLSARGEDEVVRDDVAATEAVVGVDPSARAVEEDVPGERGLRSLRLHVEARLLLIKADLTGEAAGDEREARVLPVCAVDPAAG